MGRSGARVTRHASRLTGRASGVTRHGILLCLSLALAGCSLGSFQRPSPPVAWVGIEPRLPEGGLLAGGPTLQVLPFATATPFRSDRVTTRTGDGLWAFSHYHRWAAEPGDLVSAAAARFLGRTDLFGAVVGSGSPFEPDYRLGGSVRALYWDRAQGRLVLEVEASLVAYPAEFRAFWVRHAEAPVQGNEVSGLPHAAAYALEQVLSELRTELGRALERTPSAAAVEGRR